MISRRSFAYSSMICRASSKREGWGSFFSLGPSGLIKIQGLERQGDTALS